MKNYLLSIFLLCTSIFGQPNNQRPSFIPKIPFESEIISIPRVDGAFSVYFTYKIPYKLLVFEREEESYSAEFRVVVEISDDKSNLVARDIKDSHISVNNFESTNENNLFLQDYLLFKIKDGEYRITTIISDMNSTGELSLKPEKIILNKNEDKGILQPLVIRAEETNCSDNKVFLLANSGGNIPFSSDIYHLVIPVSDTSIKSLVANIVNNSDTVFSEIIDESYLIPIGILMCDNNLAVTKDSVSIVFRNFVIRNVNKKLTEGSAVLKLSNKEKDIEEEYESQIIWLNKPISLMEPEKAIEFLSYIEPDSIISQLLDHDESEYPKILFDYWKKNDPTPQTAYNEIMFEYYSRVDFAMKEFRGISNNNGAKSDRGMIYIRFGKPDEISRTSNPQGQVVEVWSYSNPQRNFSFIDKKGIGNFTLIENQ